MARQKVSLKQLAVDKNNTRMVIAVASAAFIVIFSLVAINALIKQSGQQSKAISQKKQALKQLESNVKEAEKLKISYQAFASQQQNVLGGSASGNGEKDGDNPRLVLDALPSKYDFPALATSLEKMLKQYKIEAITGKDDEVAQAEAEAAVTPTPVDIPFSVTVEASAPSVKPILETFERSIRPFQIQKVTIETEQGKVSSKVEGKTYFQPQKAFNVKKEQVK